MTSSDDASGVSAKSESLRIKCPNGHILKVPLKYVGKKVRCPQRECDAEFVVPGPTRSVETTGDETQKQEQRELTKKRRHEFELLVKEREHLDRISFGICTAVLIPQSVFSEIVNRSNDIIESPAAALAGLAICLVAFAIGIAFAAKRKGQSPLWALCFSSFGSGVSS